MANDVFPIPVRITEVPTGERVTYWAGATFLDYDNCLFWWTEGNGGCDCNRFLKWQEAKGVSEDGLVAAPCGHGRFTVELLGIVD